MSELCNFFVDALKEFVRVNLFILEFKRIAAQSLTISKSYSSKSRKLVEKFKKKKRSIYKELSGDNVPEVYLIFFFVVI